MSAKKPSELYCSAEARTCCPPKPDLRARPLLRVGQASELARIFKVLANDTRLRLLHALTRAGEMYVTELSESVGMKAQAISNQLQRLLDMGILACKRNGNNRCYRIADPCVISLLDQGLCLMEDAGKSRQGRKRSSKNEVSLV
jgi:ArsR family transcriptional regulator, lead/cadmium/zinc/bismuth-responsive transcriptional repressor